MATGEYEPTNEPTRRLRHAYCSVEGGLIIGGGRGVLNDDSSQNQDDRRINLSYIAINYFLLNLRYSYCSCSDPLLTRVQLPIQYSY